MFFWFAEALRLIDRTRSTSEAHQAMASNGGNRPILCQMLAFMAGSSSQSFLQLFQCSHIGGQCLPVGQLGSPVAAWASRKSSRLAAPRL